MHLETRDVSAAGIRVTNYRVSPHPAPPRPAPLPAACPRSDRSRRRLSAREKRHVCRAPASHSHQFKFFFMSAKKGCMILRLCALTKRRRAAENVPSTFFCRALRPSPRPSAPPLSLSLSRSLALSLCLSVCLPFFLSFIRSPILLGSLSLSLSLSLVCLSLCLFLRSLSIPSPASPSRSRVAPSLSHPSLPPFLLSP